MSQPKRFEVQLHEMGASIFPHHAGRFVEYYDYAALAAENERIAVELEQRCRELNLSLGQQGVQLRQIGELTAENERLKVDASDAYSLQSFLKWKGMQGEYQEWLDWRAERPSKEGRDAK